MKDETAGVAIEGYVGLEPKMYSFLVDDSSERKKAKGLNNNVVATISHSEYKDVLLNNKCLRHSMSRIQNKNHKIGTYEINKISTASYNDKIYTLNNGYGLAGVSVEPGNQRFCRLWNHKWLESRCAQIHSNYFFLFEIIFHEKMVWLSNNDRLENDKIFLHNIWHFSVMTRINSVSIFLYLS